MVLASGRQTLAFLIAESKDREKIGQCRLLRARIGDYIRGLIKNSSAGRVDNKHWASCPLCGKEVGKGKRAFGCSGWQEGCPFVLEPKFKGVTLTVRQIQVLLQQRILPPPVRIDDERHLLILSSQGRPIDLRLPAAARQKKEKKQDRSSAKS